MKQANVIKAVPVKEILNYYGISRDISTHMSPMVIASNYVRRFYKELADKLGVKTSDLIIV